MKDVKTSVPAGTFGFSFRMRAVDALVPFPQAYAVNNSNKLLTGVANEITGDFVAGWPSDPGDDTTPFTIRDYGPDAGGTLNDDLCPNNVRLSQVPLESIVSSFGIGPGLVQRNLPISTDYGDVNLDTTPTPGQIFTLDNLCGLKRVRIQIIDPTGGEVAAPTARVLVNGGFLLVSNPLNYIEMEVVNLGAIAVVNLNAAAVTVGVTAEMNI